MRCIALHGRSRPCRLISPSSDGAPRSGIPGTRIPRFRRSSTMQAGIDSAAFSARRSPHRHRVVGQDGAGVAGRHRRPHRRAQGACGRDLFRRVQPATAAGWSPRPRTRRRGSGGPTPVPSSPSSRGMRTGSYSAAFSADGIRIVTASQDKTARVWRADTGALLAELKGHADWVGSAAFSAGRRRGSSPRRGTRRRGCWRADTGALLAELKGHARPGRFRRVQPRRQPHRHRVAGQDGAGVAGRHRCPHRRAQGACGPGLSAAFSGDGTRMVTASRDKTARVWRADTGALIAELKGHAGPVVSAAFSRDGTRIVTASQDETARVWRADTGALIAELKGHAGLVVSAAFSADGSARRHRVGRRDGAGLAGRRRRLLAELKGHVDPVQFRRVQRGRQPRRHRVGRRDGAGLAGRHRRPPRRAQGSCGPGRFRRVQPGRERASSPRR